MHAFDKINDEIWLTLLWSLRLMSPWRAKFLMWRTMPDGKVPNELVHMGRWLVWTSMGLKSPSDGCWDPIRGRDRTMFDRGLAPEKKRMFHQGHFGWARPREIDPLAVECWPQMTQDVTRRLVTSSWAYGRWTGLLARVAAWKSPRRANVWLLDAALAPKGPNVSLRRDWRLTFYSFRVLKEHLM